MPPKRNPVVLIHGYSDNAPSFAPWRQALLAAGHAAEDIHVCAYKSLTNEVTIKDIAEGFDRALRNRIGLAEGKPFDAIVHSTGMLVLRAWLCGHPARRRRLKRLVALAPATFGSPLAHKGRGWLGGVFKGSRQWGPDFMEAGELILDGLELGSRFTWDLTHADLLGDNPTGASYYERSADSPYVFILCGDTAYGGLRGLVNAPGTDGTVRWAGCALNTRKLTIDLTREATSEMRASFDRRAAEAPATLPMPVWLIAGRNHATILDQPEGDLLTLVLGALDVGNPEAFDQWQRDAADLCGPTLQARDRYQQFVVRAVDERGDPIEDYFVELFSRGAAGTEQRIEIDLDVHPYAADPSLRCFHVNLTPLLKAWPGGVIPGLHVRVIASSGSELVGYHGVNSERTAADGQVRDGEGTWDAVIDLPSVFEAGKVKLFYPLTTTFIELRLNRDPRPFGEGPNRLCGFP